MKIVLTASKALMSDYNGTSYLGFASALPSCILRDFIANRLFPTYSDKNGRSKIAYYGLAKVEAKLLEEFSRDEVMIADPRKLHLVVKEDTKVLGISCMDPLGISYGSGIVYATLMLLGIPFEPKSYMSKSFMELLNHPSVKKYRPKIIVGGPASWQFVDLKVQEELGIDTVVIGEAEGIVVDLFKKAVNGEELPKVVYGKPVDVKDIPTIKTPSVNGIVEITRGCGRGCKFCTPTLLKFRSIPFEKIKEEIELNLRNGIESVGLHSDDFLRYGSKGLIPNEEKLLELFEKVQRISNDVPIGVDFVCASSVMCNPKLVERIGNDYVNVGRRTFIEVGIETGSPELIKKVMPGKVKPFKPEEYPEIVKNAVGVLNDSGWTVVATMITKIPEETEEDVIKSIELVDDLYDYDIIIFVLPFIPMGAYRGKEQVALSELVEDDLRRELLIKSLKKTVSQVKKDSNIVERGLRSRIAKYAFRFAMNYLMKKLNKIKVKTSG